MYIFGNCIDTNLGTNNSNFIYITNNSLDFPSFDDEFKESLNPKAKSFILRNKEIPINKNRDFYTNKGIQLEKDDKIFIWEFLRGLEPEYNNDFVASEKEIRERIPTDLPKIMELTEWNHPDCADSELPSKNETFKQIAQVLETGKVNFYKPTRKPNNHWKNWLNGGTL